jgi:hypothetical protein
MNCCLYTRSELLQCTIELHAIVISGVQGGRMRHTVSAENTNICWQEAVVIFTSLARFGSID